MRKWPKWNAFSMTELMVAVVVLVIIASIAVVSYQGYLDRTAMLKDETNQKIWHLAVQMDAASTGTIAGSLSEIPPEAVDRACARVIREGRPYTLLAHLAQEWKVWWGQPVAESSPYVPSSYYNQDPSILICLSDKRNGLASGFDADGRPNGPISYALTTGPGGAAGKPYSWFKNPAHADNELIVEADNPATAAAVYRHGGGKTAVYITVKGKAKRKQQSGEGGHSPGGSVGGGGRGGR